MHDNISPEGRIARRKAQREEALAQRAAYDADPRPVAFLKKEEISLISGLVAVASYLAVHILSSNFPLKNYLPVIGGVSAGVCVGAAFWKPQGQFKDRL